MELKKQTPKDKTWTDETGTAIPVTRVTALEKYQENLAHQLAAKAHALQNDLIEFKKLFETKAMEAYHKALADMGVEKIGKGKGNWHFKNFDGSIKVEISVSERIEFKPTEIEACKLKLDEYLSNELNQKEVFIKDMVKSAFETNKGSLDAKKVLSLLRYRSKTKAKLFHEALDLLEQSITRPDSRQYLRVAVKKAGGDYEYINLNFSSL